MAAKLSPSEAAVLAAMRLDVRAELPRVAKLLNLKLHQVRYALESLKSKGITVPYALINLSKIGFTEYDVSCVLSIRTAAERKQFFQYLTAAAQTTEVLESGGSYQALFTIAARTPTEVDLFLQSIGKKFGPILSEVNVSTCLSYSIFPPKYLSPSPHFLATEVTVPTCPLDRTLDADDEQVLQTLATMPDASYRDQARKLGMAASTYDTRINNLRKKQVFLGHVWLIHPGRYSHEAFRIYIALRCLTADVKKQLFQFAVTHRLITYVVEWLGNWHYCFGLLAPHVGDACLLVNELHDRFGPAIEKVLLVPILMDHKVMIAAE